MSSTSQSWGLLFKCGGERIQEAIDAARRVLARLTRAVQDADDDRYVHGTLDAERHARMTQRLAAEIANQEAELARLTALLAAAAETSSRRDRLLDVLHNGAAILESADPTRANVWLRNHLRAWAAAGQIIAIEWL